jgi:hypothetical protein
VESDLLKKLAEKSLTSEMLLDRVRKDSGLLPEVIMGVSSQKAAVRYGCAKVLMELSKEQPEKLYGYVDFMVSLLDSKHRILTWNAIITIANLARVDRERKIDRIFTKYFSFIDDEYMVTVANLVANASKIALAKPYLADRIANELLKTENISTSPHLTEECKRVIIEKAIESFDQFFDQVKDKEKVISFARRQVKNPRETLQKKAKAFVERRDH